MLMSGTEHAAITEIAVELLVVEVQLLEVLVLGDVQEERALFFFRAGMAALVVALQSHALRHLRRVELALAVGQHGFRIRAQPPVHEVEVMRRLVDHEAAGDFLLAVPAAEIVRAVQRVQQPLEVHREHVADDAAHQQVLHLRARGRVAVVEQHAHVLLVALAGVEDALRLLGRGRQRLLGDAVAAGVERAHDVVIVIGIGAGDDHAIRLRLLDHLVEVGRQVLLRLGAVGGDELRRRLEAALVRVAHRDQLVVVLERLGDRGEVHARARSHAHVHVFASGRSGGGDGGKSHGGGSGAFEHGAPVESQVTHLYVPRNWLAIAGGGSLAPRSAEDTAKSLRSDHGRA